MAEGRDEKGRFLKGAVANPAGRPKAAAGFREQCRELAPKALDALVAALDDKTQRVAAARALLEHGYGKPLQSYEDVTDKAHADEVAAYIAERFSDPAPSVSGGGVEDHPRALPGNGTEH